MTTPQQFMGIVVVDKPQDFTSFDVVAKMRGIFQTRKIGHGGTLDPMATGVLPVFLGQAAKAVDLQPRADKTYVATILLGISTDTGDITGDVLQENNRQIAEEEFRKVLPPFVGKQQQVPPMYSAVKVAGKPLYSYARAGKEVERKPRPVEIFSIDYLGQQDSNRFSIRVHCSKGTYIRTLAEEIGTALGMPATLAALRRTVAGVFCIEQAYTLQQIQAAKEEGSLQQLLLPIDTVFEEIQQVALDENQMQRLCNGAIVYGLKNAPGRFRAYCNNQFLGLVQIRQDGTLMGEKLFLQR